MLTATHKLAFAQNQEEPKRRMSRPFFSTSFHRIPGWEHCRPAARQTSTQRHGKLGQSTWQGRAPQTPRCLNLKPPRGRNQNPWAKLWEPQVNWNWWACAAQPHPSQLWRSPQTAPLIPVEKSNGPLLLWANVPCFSLSHVYTMDSI